MSGHQRLKRRTAAQIFAIPALIAVLAGIGLISALVGDGVWDGMSWVLLSLPILIFGACIGLARRANSRRSSR